MNNIFLKQLYSSCNSPPKKVRRPLNYQQKNIDDYYRSRGRTQPRRVAFSNNFVATWRYRNLYMHLGIISITFTAKPKVTDARKQQQCFNLFLSLIYSCAERLVESGVVFFDITSKIPPFWQNRRCGHSTGADAKYIFVYLHRIHLRNSRFFRQNLSHQSTNQ